MTKILMLALGVLASVSTCPASAADNKYDYDRTHHNGSYNDRSTSPSQKASEMDTYRTQTEINRTLDMLNKGSYTSAPTRTDSSARESDRRDKGASRAN